MADSGSRRDPLTTFLFGLKITDIGLDYNDGTAFFKSVSGLKMETEAVDYLEGGVTMFARKVIGPTKWGNIVLKQGFTGDDKLWKWKMNPKRVSGTIVQLGPGMKVKCKWEFVNGLPAAWTGPEYDASKNELAIESIEIAHEGLEMTEEKS
jgi:phage tail-like protein